jgi:hypothetical protein
MTAVEVVCAYAPYNVLWEVIDAEGKKIRGTLRRVSFKRGDAYVKLDLALPYAYHNEEYHICYTHDPKVPFDKCKPILKRYVAGLDDDWVETDTDGARREGWAIGLRDDQYVAKI